MNPILQTLQQTNPIKNITNIMKNTSPESIYNEMIKSNPQFKSFVEKNKGKSVEQIAKEYNVDLEQIKSFLN